MTGQQAVSTTAAQQLRQHARRVQPASNYFPSGTGRCPGHFGDNVKVNQNCLTLTDADLSGRAQANNETSIAQDPLHPSSIVASDNDYFRGDGSCGAAYSLNRGDNWNDSPAPMGFVRGTPGVSPALCQAPAANAAVANDQEIYTAEVTIPTP
jgi:hypothetical protein